MSKGKRTSVAIDTSIEPASFAVGQIHFAENSGNRKVYLTGLNAGINVVMQYWKNGLDAEAAEENLAHIKNTLVSDGRVFNKGGKKNG